MLLHLSQIMLGHIYAGHSGLAKTKKNNYKNILVWMTTVGWTMDMRVK